MSNRQNHTVLYVSDPSSVARLHLPDPVEERHIRRWIDDIADAGFDLFNQEIWSQGWTAWWTSSNYQYDQRIQHRRFLPLIGSGVQPIEIIIDHCHARGVGFVGGFRINDGHAYQAREQGLNVSEFIASNPQFRLTDFPAGKNYTTTEPLDFTFKEVRAFTLGVIEEAAIRFDLDGIELCFRDCGYFPAGTGADHAHLMTDFLAQVRRALQERARTRDRDFLLGARIHDSIPGALSLGLDAATWIREGLLDYVSPQDTMYTDFNLDCASWSDLTGQTTCKLYPGILPWTSIRSRYRDRRVPMSHAANRAIAKTYYETGADGLSIYNHFVPSLWTSPFYPQRLQTFRHLGDPERIDQSERHYIFDPTWDGHIGFGAPDKCSTRIVKANRLIIDRRNPAPGKYAFSLYEDLSNASLATLLFRGTGLTHNDRIEVRLNGHVIENDEIGRTAESDARPTPTGEYHRLANGSTVPSLPEAGWFDGRPNPTPVFSTRWFRLRQDRMLQGHNWLTVGLVESDPDARSDSIVIDEVEVFVEPL